MFITRALFLDTHTHRQELMMAISFPTDALGASMRVR